MVSALSSQPVTVMSEQGASKMLSSEHQRLDVCKFLIAGSVPLYCATHVHHIMKQMKVKTKYFFFSLNMS